MSKAQKVFFSIMDPTMGLIILGIELGGGGDKFRIVIVYKG